MQASRFSEEQIVQALRQADVGPPVVEICRKLKVTETMFCLWKQRVAGFDVSDMRRLRRVRV